MKKNKKIMMRGFTIVEMVLAIGIVSIVSYSIYRMTNGRPSAMGIACSSLLRMCQSSAVCAQQDGLWTIAADIVDAKIDNKMDGGIAMGTKPHVCQLGGTYTYGAAVGWDATANCVKRPLCSYGPPNGYNGDNTTFPSALHNVRDDATQ